MELTNIDYIRIIMARYGFGTKKRLGQNFLINRPAVEAIADAACGDGLGMIEIGPGIGTLTQKLADRCEKVVAIELDKSLIPVLNDTLSDKKNVKIINADALKTDYETLINTEFPDMKVAACANLPYYITSPAILALTAQKRFEHLTLMMQKEVADRLCSAPGSPEYGSITAAVAYRAKAERLFDVSPSSFLPPPKVTSTVVNLNIYKNPPVDCGNEALFERIIRASFGQRRKTLVNALSAGMPEMKKEDIRNIVVALGYGESIRGETLGIGDFAALTRRFIDELDKK